MSDVQTSPTVGGDFAAAPQVPAPAQASPAPAPVVDHAAIAAAVVAALQQTGSVPAAAPPATTATATAPATTAAPSSSTPADSQPADTPPPAPAYKTGDLALYKVEHLGREHWQAMLVLDSFNVTDAEGATVEKLRLLPLGRAHEHAELPASQVTAASAFDWEHAA